MKYYKDSCHWFMVINKNEHIKVTDYCLITGIDHHRFGANLDGAKKSTKHEFLTAHKKATQKINSKINQINKKHESRNCKNKNW